MGRFLIWLSGAQADVIARAPTDRGRYAGIGFAILFTSSMAAVSATFALTTALKVPMPFAVLFGLLWGTAIMGLDRWLVLTIQRHESKIQVFLPALPRVALAILFGVVISTPLVLQIFHPEIDKEIVTMREEQAQSFVTQQRNGSVGAQINRLTQERTQLNAVITSGGDGPVDPAVDPTIRGLEQQLKSAQQTKDRAFDDWSCQVYGKPGGCKVGNGPLAARKKADYDSATAKVKQIGDQITARTNELKGDNETGRSQRVATARQQLKTVDGELSNLTTQRDLRQKDFDAKNKEADGLLMRLKALNRVSAKDSTMRTVHWTLFLFILAIECLPVLVKLLQALGKPSVYEQVLDMEVRVNLQDARTAMVERTRGTLVDGLGTGLAAEVDRIWEDPTPTGGGRLPPDPGF
ncbi:MAG: DUF4407 domain-containing protein [Actinoallomurus sp.]